MLSIGPMKNGQQEYYLTLAREDYYLDGGEPQGRWLGRGAKELGLDGPVEADELRQLFEGFAPDGTPLVQNAGKPHRQPGWDLTFSAPKSVSVLWSQLEDPTLRAEIQEAHFAAVEKTIGFLEEGAALLKSRQTGRGSRSGRTRRSNVRARHQPSARPATPHARTSAQRGCR